MGQDDVLTWLQAHPGWHGTMVIVRGIGKCYDSTYLALRSLAKHGEIQKRPAKRGLEWSI